MSRCSQLESCALWRILDATRHLAAPASVDEALQKTIDSSLDVLNADRASVFLHDSSSDELYTKVSASLSESGTQGRPDDWNGGNRRGDSHVIRFPAGMGIAGETAQTRRLINVPHCYVDPRLNPEVDRQTGYVTRCMLSVPLLGVDGALVGVLQVLNKQAGPFDEDDERIATILAAHCAVALQKAMLLEEYVSKQKMEPDLDNMATKPFVRKVILRLPRSMWPVPKTYGHVISFTADGKVVADLQDPSGAYPETTSVTETTDRLYIQSLHAKGLGWLPK